MENTRFQIRTLREKAKLTQTELATQIGVKPNSVSMWESGACIPRIDTLIKLMDLLKCDFSDLFPELKTEKR